MNLPMYLREADSLKKREAGLSTTSNKDEPEFNISSHRNLVKFFKRPILFQVLGG